VLLQPGDIALEGAAVAAVAVGEDVDVSQYFLAAVVEYLSPIMEFEQAIVDWLYSLL
jgi:hypothetical protein